MLHYVTTEEGAKMQINKVQKNVVHTLPADYGMLF